MKDSSAHTPSTNARPDRKKNRGLMLVSVAMAGGGIALVVLGLQKDWGFLAVFWSGVLAFIGAGWVFGLLKGGGMAEAGCPHCGAAMSFTHIESSRTQKCKSCGQWSTGTASMRALDADHVAREAVFSTPLPEAELVWPTDAGGVQCCPVCAKVSTRSVKVEASSTLGNAFAALSPISLQRVHKLRVPACAEHDDGVLLDMGGDDSTLKLSFRSWPYFQAFERLNSKGAKGATVEATELAEKMPEAAQTLADFLKHNPRPVELRAPVVCPKHGTPVLTAMGWTSTMDVLPANWWMDQAQHNPVCLFVSKSLERPEHGNHEQERVAWCAECERGMAELARER